MIKDFGKVQKAGKEFFHKCDKAATMGGLEIWRADEYIFNLLIVTELQFQSPNNAKE